ncbi:MAG: hypothetical protein K2O52_07675 [Oscillospiraceae bacterium]|nr:hypothetical protein [Oscillospiraceae bacterium]MDE7094774.1 hypothetical protein [Oscillospiraceae bacterium]
MNENKKKEDVLQEIPHYSELTDNEKFILATTIKNILLQNVSTTNCA